MTRALAVVLVLSAGVGGIGIGGVRPAVAQAPDLDALVKPAPRCDPARKHCIGLRLHIAVGDQGPVAAADWITRQLQQAHRHFEPLDVSFQIEGVAPLPASAARIEDARERTSLAPRVAGTVIDVFVTGQLDDIDIKGAIIYGVTWPKGAKKYVILSTMAWERTLAHELGHVFGLPHSTYAVSIMNKSFRLDPPLEQRTFHPNELAAMRLRLQRLLRDKIVADLPRPKPAPTPPVAAPAQQPPPSAPAAAPTPTPTPAPAEGARA